MNKQLRPITKPSDNNYDIFNIRNIFNFIISRVTSSEAILPIFPKTALVERYKDL